LSESDAPATIVEILEEMDVLDDVDLVVGGPPCQGYSHANERNPDDPRNALVQHFQDCIEEIDPDTFLMENVTGLKTMEGGDLFDKVKQEFRDIGFNIEWDTLRAEEFGVPQKRRRIFVAGTTDNTPDLLPVEPLFSDSDATKPPVITVGDAIGDLPDETVAEMDITTEYASDPQHPYQKYVRGVYGFEEMYDDLCEMADTMDQARLGSY
jgi:DNA (cytosine-5)-methyltransferase 1